MMAYVITDKCKNDKSCLNVCPVVCIFQGKNTLVIDPDACIDCDECAKVCPHHAIYLDEEVPDPKFIKLNLDQSRTHREAKKY